MEKIKEKINIDKNLSKQLVKILEGKSRLNKLYILALAMVDCEKE